MANESYGWDIGRVNTGQLILGSTLCLGYLHDGSGSFGYELISSPLDFGLERVSNLANK